MQLTKLAKFLILCPITNIFGIDRFYLKEQKSGLIRLGLFYVGIFYYLFDLVKFFQKKYSTNLNGYLKQEMKPGNLFLALCPLTSLLGVDRFVYGYKTAGAIRMLSGLLLVGYAFHLVDLILLSTGKYNANELF